MQESKVYLLDCGTMSLDKSYMFLDADLTGIAERLEDGIGRQIECAAVGTPSRHSEPDSRNRGTPFVDVGVHRPFSGWSSNWQ